MFYICLRWQIEKFNSQMGFKCVSWPCHSNTFWKIISESGGCFRKCSASLGKELELKPVYKVRIGLYLEMEQFAFDFETKTVEPNSNRVSGVLIGSANIARRTRVPSDWIGACWLDFSFLLVCLENEILFTADTVAFLLHFKRLWTNIYSL